jgi:hypothetical protein
MDVRIGSVLAATVALFVVGAVWYMPVFGTLWGKIHDFDKRTKAEQAVMQKSMMPWLIVQFLLGGVTAYFLAFFISLLPEQSVYSVAFWLWLGFNVPTQVSAVVFGGTAPKWMLTKIAIMTSGSLVGLLVAAWVVQIMG